MRAIWMTRRGGTEVLEVREGPDPEPAAAEVRIRVRATGLNFADIIARIGLYPAAPKPPCVLGYEVSGIVDRLGSAVQGFAVGDRVVALTKFGGHADVVCVAGAYALKLPDAVSFETAAALPVNYLTAHYMVGRVANLRSGDTLLLHMAAGGVGLAVLQLCRIIGGVRVIGTASAAKHDVLRLNGCEHPVDYRTQDYSAEVRRITGGAGVDAVFDPLGGKDWKRGYKLLRPGGRLVAYGFSNLDTGGKRNFLHIMGQLAGMPRFTPLKLLTENRIVAGVSLSDLWGEPLMGDLRELVQLSHQGKILPVIDAKFPFSRVAEAHQRIEQRKNVGKVLLVPDDQQAP
jgi:NADPH:quinone reductase-like Zn-dependent oxidoreductase